MGRQGLKGIAAALLPALALLALPSAASAAVNPTFCTGLNDGPSGTPNFVFNDDMENPSSGKWALTGEWSQGTTASVTSGTQALIGGTVDDPPDGGETPAVYAATMASDVTVPDGGFLRFNHDYGFGQGDAGVVEFSTDGGATWNDVAKGGNTAGPLAPGIFGYPGQIPSNNPLGSPPKNAFFDDSGGYQTVRIPLDNVRNGPFRFRFVIGTDHTVGGDPWFVDDFSIYNCPPTIAITGGTPDGALIQKGIDSYHGVNYTFTSNGEQGRFECRLDNDDPGSAAYEHFQPCFAPLDLEGWGPVGTHGLDEGNYTFQVRGVELVSSSGAVLYSPALQRTFSISYSCVQAEYGVQLGQRDLRHAKNDLEHERTHLANAEKAGNEDLIEKAEEGIVRAKKKVKRAKKKIKKAQALVDQECGTA